MIFYLRKVEGADVLLADETNIFRQHIHRFNQVAPEPPPITEVSLSTRKPRPTKLEKLMQKHGVESASDLPAEYQPLKAKVENSNKRNSLEPLNNRPHPLQPAAPHLGSQSTTPRTLPHQVSTGEVPQFALPEQPNFSPPVTMPPSGLHDFDSGLERAFVPGSSFMQSHHGSHSPSLGNPFGTPTSTRDSIFPTSISMNTHGLVVHNDLFATPSSQHHRNASAEPEPDTIKEFDLLANLSDDEDDVNPVIGTRHEMSSSPVAPGVEQKGIMSEAEELLNVTAEERASAENRGIA